LLDKKRTEKFTSRGHVEPLVRGTEMIKSYISSDFLASLTSNESNYDSFFNDFLQVFNEPEKTVYNSIITSLYKFGAQFAGLSGTGSTCFGIFYEKAVAKNAVVSLKKDWGFVECCNIYKVITL